MEAQIQFDDASHTYTDLHDGAKVVSVTQVLNAVGIVSYDHIPQSVLAHKAEIGKAAHAACHFFDEGDLNWSTVDDEAAPYVQGWLRFRAETDFEPRLIEHRGIATVNGVRYGYTLDREGEFSGRDTILEIKCTAGIEMSWGPQLAAYEMARREQDGKPRKRIAVHLRPNGTYSLHDYTDMLDYKVFQYALLLENWKRGKGKFDGYGSRSTR